MNAVKSIAMCSEAQRNEAHHLLAAFIGCFIGTDEEAHPFADSALSGSRREFDVNVEMNEYDVLHGICRSLWYLVCKGCASQSKEELERVIHIVCEQRVVALRLHDCSPGQQEEAVVVPLLRLFAGIRVAKVDVSDDFVTAPSCAVPGTGDSSENLSPRGATMVLPCSLLYVTYYLACSLSGEDEVLIGSHWARLFFTRILDSNIAAPAGVTQSASDDQGLPFRGSISVCSLRQSISQLFATAWPRHDPSRILLFADAYIAWVKKDFHSAIQGTAQLLRALPYGEEECTVLWLVRHVSRFIHTFGMAFVTNLADVEEKREMARRLQHVSEDFSEREEEDCDTYTDASPRSPPLLPSRPRLLQNILRMVDDVIFSENGCNDAATYSTAVSDAQTGSLCPRGTWCFTFVQLLGVWLCAKRSADMGDMTVSRDAVWHVLKQYARCLNSDENVSPSTSNKCSCNSKRLKPQAISDCTHSVVTLHLPYQWLRQLLLINCAALVDTSTVCRLLECRQGVLYPSEALFLSVCPTLVAGGTQTGILNTFPVSGAGAGVAASTFVRLVECLPLPVQIPLLMQRIWQMQRERAARDVSHSRRVSVSNPVEGRSNLFILYEIMELCIALVKRAQGLFGSLELGCTDCSPHRAVFEAITAACDVQEEVLRLSTEALTCGGAASSLRSSCSNVDNSLELNGDIDPELAETSTEIDTRGESLSLHPDITMEGFSPGLFLNAPRSCSSKDGDNGCESCPARNKFTMQKTFSVSAAGIGSDSRYRTAHGLYWLAHGELAHWLNILSQGYPQLELTLQLCQLRIAAASFDERAPRLARQLLSTHRNNALASVHATIALFASLHIVQAERCIREAVQVHPHSAELQRLHRTISDHIDNSNKNTVTDCADSSRVAHAVPNRSAGPMYAHRYRGLLTVHVELSSGPARVGCRQYVASAFTVAVLAAFIALHTWEAQGSVVDANPSGSTITGDGNRTSGHKGLPESQNTLKNVMDLQWTFLIPFTPPMCMGIIVVLYAGIVAFVVPAFIRRGFNLTREWVEISLIHRALLQAEFLVDDTANRLAFCLRGVTLVNIVNSIQLVAVNLWHLQVATTHNVTSNETTSLNGSSEANAKKHALERQFVLWSTVSVLIVLVVLSNGVFFHAPAWRITRTCDIIRGTIPKLTTVYMVDALIIIFLLPVLFTFSVIVEPLMFFVALLQRTHLSLPPFSHCGAEKRTEVEFSCNTPVNVIHSSSTPTDDFCAIATTHFQTLLKECNKPQLCSVKHRHQQDSGLIIEKNTKRETKIKTTSGVTQIKTNKLLRRVFNGCINIHEKYAYKILISPFVSESSVRTVQLRESYLALLHAHSASFCVHAARAPGVACTAAVQPSCKTAEKLARQCVTAFG
uniref:Uncharacterized protein n=1 Tax=Trypanosoma vivax (strain Y486) TaxID=1055687 RepID=G0TZ16_TRYVY|nr:conserved hypothetical protein [Trypanosoma vivax Y486]